MNDFYLIYLDRYHLGDELFIDELAQRLHRAPTGPPSCGIIHGSGEKVERTLESQGLFPERTNGTIDVDDAKTRQLVERSVRESNQEIVAALTDEVVPTVGIQGVDRSLFQLETDGHLIVSKVGWVAALIKQRVVPVVSALAHHPTEGHVQELAPAQATTALAQALAEEDLNVTVVFFTQTGQSGLADALGVKEEVAPEAIADTEAVPEGEVIQHVHQAGLQVLITDPQGLFQDPKPTGTRVEDG